MPVWTVGLLMLAMFVGCSRSEPAKSTSQPTPSAVNAPSAPPQPVVAAPQPPAAQPAPSAPQPPSQPAAQASPNAPAAPSNTVEKKAEVGAGEKGHYDTVGPIVTPIASYFAIRERMAYEIQIPEAMKLFKATEDRVPKSHEEFMQRIVKENNIVLPQLPEGHTYIYDPKRGELMVRQPRQQ